MRTSIQPAKPRLLRESDLSYQPLVPSTSWQPGFWCRFPWQGLLALGGALVATILMIIVLVVSDGKPVTDGKLSPAVYLALLSAIANVLLAFAMKEGVTVAWWVTSMRPGTTVSDLHNVWSFGTSLRSSILSGRSFNLVALAGITVALAPINGPLLQRASVVTIESISRPASLTIRAAQELPFGYTGTITGPSHQFSFPTRNFSRVVNDFGNQKPISLSNNGCKGRCIGSIKTAGYKMDCDASAVPYSLSGPQPTNYSTGSGTLFDGVDVFTTNFSYMNNNPSGTDDGSPILNFTALVKTTSDCDGNLSYRKCTIVPALVESPVIIQNDSISLNPGFSYHDDRIVRLIPAPPYDGQDPGSTRGGMGLVLSSMFDSSVRIKLGGPVPYDMTASGNVAFQYSNSDYDYENCTMAWSDPTEDILAAVRELAFRTALRAANASDSTDLQQLDGLDEDIVTLYRSHFGYLSAALLFTLLSPFCIFSIFFGWWNLGRKVTTSPIETAKAFNAPGLACSDSNFTIKDLLGEVGERKVKYGSVKLAQSTLYGGISVAGLPEKLMLSEPEWIARPRKGRLFVG